MHQRPFRLLLAGLAVWLAPFGAEAAPACEGENILSTLSAEERGRLDAAVAAQAYPEGNYWRATRDGSRIDLIGTFHMYDSRMDDIAGRLAPTIAAADQVLLEATSAEFAQLQAEIARRPELLITTGPTLPERLSADEWAALSDEMAQRGIPPFMASKFQPWYVTVLLGVPPCAIQTLGEREGLDAFVAEAAESAGVPVAALEPYDTVFRIFSVLSPDEQIDMVRASLPLADRAEDMFATLVDSYFAEEHRLIWELSRMAATEGSGADSAAAAAQFALLEEALLNGRNRAWMDVILPAAEGRSIVVAAGAAHLAGEDGLLNLLAEDGWTLERQPF